jgi:peroxiredoxin
MHEHFSNEKQPANPIVLIIVGVCFILGIGLGYIFNGSRPDPLAEKRGTTPGTPTLTPGFSAFETAAITITPIPPFNLQKITPQPLQVGRLVGKVAPDFSLKTLDGQVIQLSALKGKAVLINLWATWCPPCRLEMPTIQAAYQKYKDRGLVVLAINFTAQDNLSDVSTFVKELKLTFPVLLDPTGDVSTGLYGMYSLPMSFFIDPQGVIRNIQFGAMDPAKIEGYITEILPTN